MKDPNNLRTHSAKASILEVLDVQEEKRQTYHQDVMNRSSRRELNTSSRRQCYRNSLVVSEPELAGTGDIMINTADVKLEEQQQQTDQSAPEF